MAVVSETLIEIVDNSGIPQRRDDSQYKPLFMQACATPKGEEGLVIIDRDFEKLFGKIDFEKYGLPQLVVDRLIENGAKVLFKRVVPNDAKLANMYILAKLKHTQVQKQNESGQNLYLKDGVETTDSSDAVPIMIKKTTVKYVVGAVENKNNLKDIVTDVMTKYSATDDGEGFTKTLPLHLYVDIGRGESDKRIRISPDYDGSKNTLFLRYDIRVLEGTNVLEYNQFTFDSERIYYNRPYSLEANVNQLSKQIRARAFDKYIKEFVKEIVENTTLPDNLNIFDHDILFGYDKLATKLENLTVDPASANLNDPFGLPLLYGTNGNYKNAPMTESGSSYKQDLVDFFSGEYNDDIYDHVRYPIEGIIDSRYPAEVKRAIEKFVSWREDVFFFGDMEGVENLEDIKAYRLTCSNNFPIGYNPLTYDIIEPKSRKQYNVNVGYSLARILPQHFKNGRNRPLSGLINQCIITEAIPGTVNFIPKKTPKRNEKQIMNDLRLCYATYLGDDLILEKEFTTNPLYTQLSYINNVLAMQEVIRAVRLRCPRTRYSFIDGKDLDTYKSDVQEVLNKFTGNFKSLIFEYIQDEVAVLNKIFYAAIKIEFRNFVEAEHFKIMAINSVTGSTDRLTNL